MKLIKTEDAVGCVLCHDMTQIIKGVKKDAVFRKGHVVTQEDIPVLLSIGKDHIYVWEADETMLHENEAAKILCDLCKNDFMEESEIKEGKIELTAACDGLLKIDRDRLKQINQFGQMMIASRHGNTSVKKGDKLAGMRIIPLVIEKEKMEAVKTQCGEKPILTLLPFKKKKAAILTTGNEVFYGRIKDQFIPTIEEKLSEYDAELVICTGGMSVDPDDKTPRAIKNTGAEIVSYGAPVLPGAMFLLSYYKEQVPVIGLRNKHCVSCNCPCGGKRNRCSH